MARRAPLRSGRVFGEQRPEHLGDVQSAHVLGADHGL